MAKIKNTFESRAGSERGQAQRVGLFGASGSGKTTKARELTSNLKRIIYFDPLADFCTVKGVIVINGSVDRLKEVIIKHYTSGFKIAFIPVFGQQEKQLNDVCYFLVDMQRGYLAGFHNAQITLLVDELDEGFYSGIMQRDPKNGFGYLCKRGRHFGINLVGISQRTAQVDVCFRGNLSALYLFRHVDPIDTQKAMDMIGRKYKQAFENLENYHYFYKSGSQVVQK